MGWPLFGSKPFLSAEDEAWHLETWAWLLSHWGGLQDLKRSPLVTPSREFFPPSDASGHARALYVFGLVKEHAKMQGWACRLEAQPERPNPRVAEYVVLKSETGTSPLGTFGPIGNEVVITYDPGAANRPHVLIATLAHELAHYRLAFLPGDPPGGPEMDEYATDLATVYLGFGLFSANCAFNFSQHQDFMTQGWSYSRQGYLSERDWVFALAVFFRLTEREADQAKAWLKPHLYSDFQKALKRLDSNRALLEPLRKIAAGTSRSVTAAESAGSQDGAV